MRVAEWIWILLCCAVPLLGSIPPVSVANSSLSTTPAASVNGVVYASAGTSSYSVAGAPGQSYVPVTLRDDTSDAGAPSSKTYYNTPLVGYTRGSDLSGSRQGAGGVGGLLARTDHYEADPAARHAYYHSDGSGNITMLINSRQLPVASYQYDPFGNLLAQAGPLAEANTYRFSSKELHAKSGLYYYGFRFYDPNLQRWLNHDPIQELGGLNLYSFVFNSPLDWIDRNGLEPVSVTHYNKGGLMVHSEVPVPDGGQGGVHIQIGKNKYHFNTQTGDFGDLPKDFAKKLQQDPKFRRGIGNACRRVNEHGGFAPRYGGGLGRFIPALAALLALAQGEAIAQDVQQTAQDYLRGLSSGDDVSAEAAILRNQFNSLAPLSGEVAFPVLLK